MSILEINVQAKPKDFFPTSVLTHYINMGPALVGSQYICSPCPEDSDQDWVMAVESIESCVAALEAEGWVKDGGENYKLGEEFVSMRQEGNKVNLILTKYEEFYHKFRTAARICKLMNVHDKAMRIKIHDLVFAL